jgi:hypothetical protein
MPLSFAVTWDYRCPFARNAHEHLLAGLAGGADWDVRFVPFTLGQVHVPEGGVDVWDEPERDSGLLALQAGVVVRDRFPEQFQAVHHALFAARHDEALHIKDPQVVRDVLTRHDVDADEVLAAIDDGTVLKQVRDEHESIVASHQVWGVPTFISGEHAVFVRFMTRPKGDAELGQRTIERTIDLLDGFPELNEFKHTSIPR